MALTKAAQEKLLKALKVKDEDIATLLAEGTDNDVELPEGIEVLDAESKATLIENTKNSVKSGYYRAGQEILINKLKEEEGLDFSGKDPKVFIEKYKEKVLSDANIDPEKAKQGWETEKQSLQQSVVEWQKKYTELEGQKKAADQQSEWLRKFPGNRNSIVSDEDKLLLLSNKLTTDEDGGYIYKGQPLKDHLQNNLSLDKAMEFVFEQEKWLDAAPPPQGRGAGNSRVTTGVFTKQSEVKEQWVKDGKGEPRGADYQAHLASLLKENPQLNLNE